MSEFQQYQFRTIDQALSREQQKRIGSLSSRSKVTSTSATFVYHYSDFRGNVKKLMINDFDAMFYLANWGTRRLMFRFPKDLIDIKAIMTYAIVPQYSESYVDFFADNKFLVMDIEFSEEDGDGYWIDEEDYSIDNFLPLREAIINGDYRMLYMAWLGVAQGCTEHGEDEYDFEENHPPIPDNLKKIASPLEAFMTTFRIDRDMVSAAAQQSSSKQKDSINYKTILKTLSLKEKENFLHRLLEGEPRLDIKLKKYLENLNPKKSEQTNPSISLQTIKTASKEHELKRLEKERIEAEIAHGKRMDQVALEEDKHWKRFYADVETKSGRSYDNATTTLKDLADMYTHKGRQNEFQVKLQEILQDINSKALLNRFEKVGII